MHSQDSLVIAPPLPVPVPPLPSEVYQRLSRPLEHGHFNGFGAQHSLGDDAPLITRDQYYQIVNPLSDATLNTLANHDTVRNRCTTRTVVYGCDRQQSYEQPIHMNFILLPAELIAQVFAHVQTPDLVSLASTCAYLNLMLRDMIRYRIKQYVACHPIHLNVEQYVCFHRAVNLRQSICILGEPGTGKSCLMRAMRREFDKRGIVAFVCAPTGLAAANVEGMTIHEYLGENVYERTQQQLEQLAATPSYPPLARLLATQVLFIDEISMVSAQLFAYMDRVMRILRRKHTLPFGGVQLVCMGDFYQLPPVEQKPIGGGGGGAKRKSSSSAPPHVIHQSSIYCFQTLAWYATFGSPTDGKILLLNIQMRSARDPRLLRLLRNLRADELTLEDRVAIENRRSSPTIRALDGALQLSAHRSSVAEYNDRHLAALRTKSRSYVDTYYYHLIRLFLPTASVPETLELASSICERRGVSLSSTPTLQLRDGARVVLTANFRAPISLHNRQLGTVCEVLDLSVGETIEELYWRLTNYQNSIMGASEPNVEFRILGNYDCCLCYTPGSFRLMLRTEFARCHALDHVAYNKELGKYDTFVRYEAQDFVPHGFSIAATSSAPSDDGHRSQNSADVSRAFSKNSKSALRLPVVRFDAQPSVRYLVLPYTRGLFQQETIFSQAEKRHLVYHRLVATTTYMPLELGYAQTIHAAQGSTLNAVRLDLDGCWSRELVYVAFSRVRSMDNLMVVSHPKWDELYGPMTRPQARPSHALVMFMESVVRFNRCRAVLPSPTSPAAAATTSDAYAKRHYSYKKKKKTTSPPSSSEYGTSPASKKAKPAGGAAAASSSSSSSSGETTDHTELMQEYHNTILDEYGIK
jgi:hypothetical protein